MAGSMSSQDCEAFIYVVIITREDARIAEPLLEIPPPVWGCPQWVFLQNRGTKLDASRGSPPDARSACYDMPLPA